MRPAYVGSLGALLYPGEAVAIPGRSGSKHGRYCCAEGQVELGLPVSSDRRYDVDDADGRLLRKHARQFNDTSLWRQRCTMRPRRMGGRLRSSSRVGF